MIPEFLILNSEKEATELALLTQYLPVQEGEVFRNILECIGYDRDADLQLEVHARDVETMMIEGGHGDYAEWTSRLILKLGREILGQLRKLKAYHNGYLIYCYHQDLNGDLVLRALEHDDLQMNVPSDDDRLH